MDEAAARPIDPREVINEHLAAATVELFAAHGAPVVRVATGHGLTSSEDGDWVARTGG